MILREIYYQKSEPINSKKFNDVFVSDNGYATKIEIEYINFNRKFLFSFLDN